MTRRIIGAALALFLSACGSGPAQGSVSTAGHYSVGNTPLSRDLHVAAATLDVWNCMFHRAPLFDLYIDAEPVEHGVGVPVGRAIRSGEFRSITIHTDLLKEPYAETFRRVMTHEIVHHAMANYEEHDTDPESLFFHKMVKDQVFTDDLYIRVAAYMGAKGSAEECGFYDY